MKVLVIQHFRIPYQCAGSEMMLHRMALALKDAGHTVQMITTDTPQALDMEIYDEMVCHSVGKDRNRMMILARSFKPDVILSHHQRAEMAIPIARQLKVKSIFVMHNDFSHNQRVLMHRPDLVVFNTEWIAHKFRARVRRGMVIHPPVYPDHCDLYRGEKVTLINKNRDKGGEIFYRLAAALPEVEFMAVQGAHGHQVEGPELPNVVEQPHTANMCWDVWSETKILLMPSIYESYGMTGVEALCMGIPVLANPTPGLKESLGDAGWFIPRNDEQAYVDAITMLMSDDDFYHGVSGKCLARASQLGTVDEMAQFVKTVEAL